MRAVLFVGAVRAIRCALLSLVVTGCMYLARRHECASTFPDAVFVVARAAAQDQALARVQRAGILVRARDDDRRPHSQAARVTLVSEGASQSASTDSVGVVLLVPRFPTRQRLRVQRIGLGTVSDTITPRIGFVDTLTLVLGQERACLGPISTT